MISNDHGEIIAFLSIDVHHETEEYIYLDDFSVAKQYRGMGIGRSMIRNAESYAKQIHIPAICFHVEKSNIAALRENRSQLIRKFADLLEM